MIQERARSHSLHKREHEQEIQDKTRTLNKDISMQKPFKGIRVRSKGNARGRGTATMERKLEIGALHAPLPKNAIDNTNIDREHIDASDENLKISVAKR